MSNTLVKRKKSLNLGQYSFVLIFAALFLIYFFVNFKNGVPMLRWTGVTNILRHSAIVGLLSYGMAMIIITGDIDLSIGAILGCVSSFGCVIANIMLNAGVPSPNSLYDPESAAVDEDHVFDQADAHGCITPFGLPIKVKAMIDQKKGK